MSSKTCEFDFRFLQSKIVYQNRFLVFKNNPKNSLMQIIKIISVFLLIITCASCKKRRAPIENHSRDFYTKNYDHSKNKYSKNSRNSVGQNFSKGSKIKIEAGETLYGIAQKYNVNIRDLIEENNLSAPYNLRVGQVLAIPRANYHEVKTGETLYGISRDYKINVNEIVALNKMTAPYSIYAGQKIKIGNEVLRKSESQERRVATYKAPQKRDESRFKTRILSSKDNKFSWPIKGRVISDFGPKKGGLYNDGINIQASSGSAIKSSEDGIVAYVGNELKGYGNLVILKHASGWISAYGHLQKAVVARGESVKKSQIIAYAGATGNVDSPQLYFGLRKGRDAVNPRFYLKQ